MVTSCGVTDIDVIRMTGCMVLSPSERIQVGAFEKKTKKNCYIINTTMKQPITCGYVVCSLRI